MPRRLPLAPSASQSHDPSGNSAQDGAQPSVWPVGWIDRVPGSATLLVERAMNLHRNIACLMCAGLLVLGLIGGTATTASAHARMFLGLSAPVYYPPPYYHPY